VYIILGFSRRRLNLLEVPLHTMSPKWSPRNLFKRSVTSSTDVFPHPTQNSDAATGSFEVPGHLQKATEGVKSFFSLKKSTPADGCNDIPSMRTEELGRNMVSDIERLKPHSCDIEDTKEVFDFETVGDRTKGSQLVETDDGSTKPPTPGPSHPAHPALREDSTVDTTSLSPSGSNLSLVYPDDASSAHSSSSRDPTPAPIQSRYCPSPSTLAPASTHRSLKSYHLPLSYFRELVPQDPDSRPSSPGLTEIPSANLSLPPSPSTSTSPLPDALLPAAEILSPTHIRARARSLSPATSCSTGELPDTRPAPHPYMMDSNRSGSSVLSRGEYNSRFHTPEPRARYSRACLRPDPEHSPSPVPSDPPAWYPTQSTGRAQEHSRAGPGVDTLHQVHTQTGDRGPSSYPQHRTVNTSPRFYAYSSNAIRGPVEHESLRHPATLHHANTSATLAGPWADDRGPFYPQPHVTSGEYPEGPSAHSFQVSNNNNDHNSGTQNTLSAESEPRSVTARICCLSRI